MLYSTFPNRAEALSAARALVEGRLAACANLLSDVTSVYEWQGAVQQEQEVVMLAKTDGACVQAAIAKIKSLHSYELPAITAWNLKDGHPEFLRWVSQQTAGKSA